MNNQARVWAGNRWLQAILLSAFLVRALIPAGFMPGPGGLVFCSGYAPAAAGGLAMNHDMSGMDMSGAAAAHHSHHGSTDSKSGHDGTVPCPFAAAAGTLASASSAHALATFAAFVSTKVDLPPPPALVRDTVVPARLPRGPPSLLS